MRLGAVGNPSIVIFVFRDPSNELQQWLSKKQRYVMSVDEIFSSPMVERPQCRALRRVSWPTGGKGWMLCKMLALLKYRMKEDYAPFKNFLLAYFLKKASWVTGRAR